MAEFDDDLARAGDALQALADGPGQAAADSLGKAFEGAGAAIETALGQAARRGELDFSNMAKSVLADLAKIATEAALAQAGLGGGGQTVNLNMAVGGGADAAGVIGAKGQIANAVAKAAALGGRFI